MAGGGHGAGGAEAGGQAALTGGRPGGALGPHGGGSAGDEPLGARAQEPAAGDSDEEDGASGRAVRALGVGRIPPGYASEMAAQGITKFPQNSGFQKLTL